MRKRTYRAVGVMAAALWMAGGSARAQSAADRFTGGSHDGWDGSIAAGAVFLSSVDVTFSSGEDQAFTWTNATLDLATATLTATDAGGILTNGAVMRISVPSAWHCRFDSGAGVSYAGSAAAKVVAAAFSGDGSSVEIEITSDFANGDDLQVSGLRLIDLPLCRAGAERLELDFSGDGESDIYDDYELACTVPLRGGSYDGWDSFVMTNAAPVGGVDYDVALSSGQDQTFTWTNFSVALASATITATEAGGLITNGVVMSISLPSDWQCRFSAVAGVSYGGSAAAKVAAATLSGDAKAVHIEVTGDFVNGDDLEVSGMRLVDTTLCRAGSGRLGLDFDGDDVIDGYDEYTLEVSVPWPGGEDDGWDGFVMETYGRLRGMGGTRFLMH